MSNIYIDYDNRVETGDLVVFQKTDEYKNYVKKIFDLNKDLEKLQNYIDKSKDRKKIGKWLDAHPKLIIIGTALAVGGLMSLSGGLGIFLVSAILGLPVGLGAWHISTSYFKKIYPDLNRDKISKYSNEINKIEKDLKKAEREVYYDLCEFLKMDPYDCDDLDKKLEEMEQKRQAEEQKREKERQQMEEAERKSKEKQPQPFPDIEEEYDDEYEDEDDYIKVDNEEPYEANNQGNKQEDNAVQMTDEEVMRMLQNTSYNQNVTQEPEWASDQDVINSNPYDRPQDGGRGRR